MVTNTNIATKLKVTNTGYQKQYLAAAKNTKIINILAIYSLW